MEKLTQRHQRRTQADLDGCDKDSSTSTQLLQIQRKQRNDPQEHLERYFNVLPVFRFSSAEFDLNLINSCLLLVLVNERNIEPTVIQKTNQAISLKFGDIQLLDFMSFLGGACSLDSTLKTHKTSETKVFFPSKALITPTNRRIQNFPHMMLPTKNFAAVTPWKPITRTILTHC